MHRKQHRALLTLTAGIATLAVGAAPALAGSDGCSGDDCVTENTPPLVLPPAPVRVAPPAPAHVAPPAPRGRSQHRVHRVRTATVGARTTVPHGAVAAGAGGTAPAGPDTVLALLAAGALVLVATGGRLVTASRGAGS